MKINELLNEGMWVVKNKDGQEKRFKDSNSPDARAWVASSSKKPEKMEKMEKYSDAWWDDLHWTGKHEGPMPDSKIVAGPAGIMSEDIEKMDEAGIDAVEDFTITRNGRMMFGKTTCATADIRVLVSYDAKEMGVEHDQERIEESVYIRVRRNEEDPRKFVFVSFV
jgi:hypothetical protein